MSSPLWKTRVGIIGLGLMGGSLARELAASSLHVVGHDADPDAMREAERAGVVQAALPDSLEGLEDVDLLVLAVPVDRAAATLEAALPHLSPTSVVTDLGSTKLSIQRAAERLGIAERFVGSHPLTGGHRSGWGASHRDLYAWTRVFLCPTAATSPASLALVRELWERVGALPEIIDAEEHDRRIAWISHLPQAAATALGLTLSDAGHARLELGPGGRDTTRLAASSPEMWSAICIDNGVRLTPALRALEEQLSLLRQAIEAGDEAALRRIFGKAREWAESERALP